MPPPQPPSPSRFPIRVALAGLSATAAVSWAADAHLPYLLSARGRARYQVVALLNSSEAAAVAAREHYGLDPATVRVYGSAEALADDEGVDLVVVNTRVDKHVPIAGPALRGGGETKKKMKKKKVYVEWPLAENLAAAAGMVNPPPSFSSLSSSPSNNADNTTTTTTSALANRSIIGLQGRVSPVALRVRELLASGAVGAVVGSELRIRGNLLPRDALPRSLAYFADREVGGNPVTIAVAHTVDYVHDILGEWDEVDVDDVGVDGGKEKRREFNFHSLMSIHRPDVRIMDSSEPPSSSSSSSPSSSSSSIRSDVPDHLYMHGVLDGGATAAPGVRVLAGATLAVHYRTGQEFSGTPGLEWCIEGESGELRVTASGAYLHSDSYAGDDPLSRPRIQLHDFADGQEVREMPWGWEAWQEELPLRARIVGEVYERYAKWWGETEGGEKERGEELQGKRREWPTLADAMVRMRELDQMWRQYDEARR